MNGDVGSGHGVARPVVAILAAGSSTRMGSGRPKLVQPVLGRPLIQWTLMTVRQSVPDATIVLALPEDDEVSAVVQSEWAGRAPIIVRVDRPDRGIGVSILSALSAGPEDAAGVAIVLGDDPIAARDLSPVLSHAKRHPAAIVAVDRQHAPHPVWLPRAQFDRARQQLLGGSAAGLHEFVSAHADFVAPTQTYDGPTDVDVPDDIERLAQRLSRLQPPHR